jgi:hypothetical protein
MGDGAFAESGADTVKLTGLRVAALVTKAGGSFQGLTLSKMNDLGTLGFLVADNSALLNNNGLNGFPCVNCFTPLDRSLNYAARAVQPTPCQWADSFSVRISGENLFGHAECATHPPPAR